MGVILIIGICWLGYTILKEAVFTKRVPPNTDYRQAFIDSYKYNLSGKELDKRMTNEYYVKKDEK